MKFTKTLTAAAIIAAGFALNAQAADMMKIAMVAALRVCPFARASPALGCC